MEQEQTKQLSLVSSNNAPPKSWTKDKKILYSHNDNSNLSPGRLQFVSQKNSATVNADKPRKSSHGGNESSRHSRHHEHRRSLGDDSNTSHDQHSHSSSNTTIIGYYELEKTLGKGNFSTVKLAHHRITNHSVAIKVVRTTVLTEDNLMKVNREIDVLKKIGKHDHIVRLYQVIKTRRYFMLVTEYCANGELYDYLVAKGKLSERQSCDFFLQILSAIEYLHDHNVVHRDLKAENLLLTDNFKTVKIADFGFANYFKRDALLSTWCGSPPYAAPELFKGVKYIGPPVDIWSLGVILYVLVCGSLPFDGHNLVYLKSRVLSGKFRIPFFMSTECESLIRGMLRLDPDRRFGIRQVRAHCWTQKYGKAQLTDCTGSKLSINQTFAAPKAAGSKHNPPIDNKANSIEVPVNSKNNDGSSGSNRGQSLDLEDDSKKDQTVDPNADASMLYLTNDSGKSISRISQTMTAQSKLSKLHNFVNTDMANAVSNMSIDSNNSSMSVSQSNETSISADRSNSTSMRHSLSRSDTGASSQLNKQNSIDDQIIEFMIAMLKVADNQEVIRNSIANDKYDDLHAIYKLIRDQPEILSNSIATFKVPSLPLINPSRNDKSSRPSITTGFFKMPKSESPTTTTTTSERRSSVSDRQTQNDYNSSATNQSSNLISSSSPLEKNDQERNQAINLVTHQESQRNSDKFNKTLFRHRLSEDQSWQPPQLFLTPPAENRIVPETKERVGSLVEESIKTEQKTQARHSFDSTMKQLACLQNMSNPNCETKLASSGNQRNCTWDSSILDSLGASTSVMNSDGTPNSPKLSGPISGCIELDGSSNKPQLNLANMAGITTNLLQIGTQIDTTNKNQNLVLTQLNAPSSCAAAFTQSGILPQMNPADQRYQTTLPAGFTPNNLVNQNYAAMNCLPIQNAMNLPGMLNLNLLDPNGLISGLERRASDGQASYNSLTCGTSSTNQTITPQHVCSASNQQPTPNTILSTSSFQLSNQIGCANQTQQTDQSQSPHQQNYATSSPLSFPFVDQRLQLEDHSSSNNSMLFSSDDQSRDFNNNIINNNDIPDQRPQQNPLDLSRGPKDSPLGSVVGGGGGYNSGSPLNTCLLDTRIFEERLNRTASQRSNSTTSASSIFNQHSPVSTTTSPRNSSLISSVASNNMALPFSQISPSSLSLSGGGPGHLPCRRKRHSLETESRHCHHNHHHHHQQQNQNGHPSPKCRHPYNGPCELSIRSQNRANYQQFFKYPINSHLGQLRNFAQTFSYKNLVKRPDTASPPAANIGGTVGGVPPQSPVAMDVNTDIINNNNLVNPVPSDRDTRNDRDLFGTPR